MRILFLSHYFPPEVNAPATRTYEHCREWVKSGHDVHVVTCVPSHPRGIPSQGYKRGWYLREERDGIHVHRVWTYLAANKGVIRRSLNYLSFMPSAVFRALRLGAFDVIIATSPQFFCAVAGAVAGALSKTPWIFELRDLWPESVAAVGAIRQQFIVRMLERLELALYRRATRVVCLTRSFADNLAGRGVPWAKLDVIPNGMIPGSFHEPDEARVRRDLGLPADATLFSYVGTVGMAHGLETILEAARRLRPGHPNVRFLVVGDGADRDEIEAHTRRDGIDTVTFTGLVTHERALELLRASDVSLVLLRKSPLFRTVLPSKLFEAMAAGRPVILGVEGEARALLLRARGGIPVEPENADALAAAIVKLAGDDRLRRELGEAGRAFIEREYDRRAWAARYLSLLNDVAARRDAVSPRAMPELHN